MDLAFILFVLIFMLYIVFADLFTILFRLTGMTEEKARFQVISLLTNSGFTTSESESVVDSKVRRSLSKIIMIFGYVFAATIISGFVTLIMTIKSRELFFSSTWFWVFLFLFILFIGIRRIRFIKKSFDVFIEKFCHRFILHDKKNAILILEEHGKLVIATILLNQIPDFLEGKTLEETDFRNLTNLMILMIRDKTGQVSYGRSDTLLQKGDVVTLMGRKSDIEDIFVKNEKFE